MSKALLERERDMQLKIFTRSDLIAHDDYIENLNPAKHEVNIVFGGTNDRINRILEPGAPSLGRRITAGNKLAEQGFMVNLVYQKYLNPALPGVMSQTQPDEFTAIKELLTRGLSKNVRITTENTRIDEAAVKRLKKILGED